MNTLIRLLLIGSLAWLLAACERSPTLRLYDGPERGRAEMLTIRVPEQLEILTINEQRVERGNTLFATGYQDLQLAPGEYRVVAYYKELWDLELDNHAVYRSDPVTFTVDGKGGEFYRLAYDKPDNAREAEQLADNFSGWSENIATGDRRDTTASGLVRPGLFTGLVAGTTAAVAEQPAVTSVAPASNAPAAPAAPAGNSGAADMGYVDMLKAYWSQASAEERREFLRWIAE